MKTEVNAKVTIQSVARTFTLKIDWDGLNEEDMRALAQRSIVIAWQNKHRTANEGAGQWPNENPSIKATDYRLGVRTQVERDPVKLIEAGELSKEQLEQLAAIIQRKMGG